MNRYFSVVLLLLPFARAFAADAATDLNPVVVTATRTAQTVDATLTPVTVITREDIERLQAQSLLDLFTGLPGISVANNGGTGKFTSVFLRGANSNQVLVLIDGIKVGSATAGTTAFEQIPVDQIERIEIVRGPRSSLYGSEAIAGVIQIFTRKGSTDGKFTPSFSIGGGTYDTWSGQAGVSGDVGHGWYSANLGGFYTNGINACNGNASTGGGCGTYEPDKDGFWDTSGSVRGGYRFDNGAEVSADWLRTYGDNHYDGSFQNQSKLVQQVLGGTFKLPRIGLWQPSVAVGQSEDQSTDFENDVFVGTFDTLRNSASWQNDFTLGTDQRVTAGVDYLKDHVFGTTDYTRDSREDIGGFAQYQGGFGNHDVQLSLRDDHDQQFGSHLTGAAAYGYSFGRALRLVASYGTAFRAPTFNDLYYPPDSYGDSSNPNLRPEKSRSGEIGIGGRPGFLNWALNAYQTNTGDLINFDFVSLMPVNVASARIRGVEARFGGHWKQWRAQTDVNLLDPRDRSTGGQNNLLPRRAQQTARLDVDRDFAHFNLGATLFASGRAFDDLANQEPLGGYGTVDLRAGCHLEKNWLLQARLSNLFDHHYETAQYYNQPGRAVFFTLRYQPASS